MKFRIRLDDDVPLGARLAQLLTAFAGPAPSEFVYYNLASHEFPPGSQIFPDVAVQSGKEVGKLYLVNPRSTTPITIWSGTPLVKPTKLTLLDDGSLAILDRSSTAGNLGAIVQYRPSGTAGTAMRTMLALEKEAGFVEPAGLTLDRDGSILIIDRDANPLGFPAPNNFPGAVFRLDPNTHAVSLVRSDKRWKQPLDAVVDRRGDLLITDIGASPLDPAVVWECPPGQDSTIAPFRLVQRSDLDRGRLSQRLLPDRSQLPGIDHRSPARGRAADTSSRGLESQRGQRRHLAAPTGRVCGRSRWAHTDRGPGGKPARLPRGRSRRRFPIGSDHQPPLRRVGNAYDQAAGGCRHHGAGRPDRQLPAASKSVLE
jgi:hypothetical protein